MVAFVAALVSVPLVASCADDDLAVLAPEETTTTIPALSEVGQRRPWDGMILPPDADGGYGSPRIGVHLAALAELGAPNVALVVPLVQDSAEASPRTDDRATPRDAFLGQVMGLAADLGLGVVVELRIESIGGVAPGPRDLGRWFDDYGTLAVHYAALAERHDAELFVIGGGASELARSRGWTEVIDRVRDVFDGPVSFSVDADELDRVSFWDYVDVIGVSATFPEPDADEPIAADIERAWEPVMAQLTVLAENWSRPVVLARVGFPGVERTTGGLGVNEDRQLDAYEALFTVANQTPALDGILVWRWGTDPATVGDKDASYSPQGRPAEEVLRRAWTTPLADDEDEDGEQSSSGPAT
jgi:hypothetical protein